MCWKDNYNKLISLTKALNCMGTHGLVELELRELIKNICKEQKKICAEYSQSWEDDKNLILNSPIVKID